MNGAESNAPEPVPLGASPAERADPFPVLAALQREAPVHLVRCPDGMDRWLVSRYQDVVAVLTDPVFSSDLSAMAPPETPSAVTEVRGEGSRVRTTMINQDPPEHTRLRREVALGIVPSLIDGVLPSARRVAEELADAVSRTGRCDLVSEFCRPFSFAVICQLLGLPAVGPDRFFAAAEAIGSLDGTPEGAARTRSAIGSMHEYFAEAVAAKRVNPAHDAISALLSVQRRNRRLSDDEISSTCLLMFFNGLDVVADLIANGMLALLAHPDQLAALRADPGLLPRTVEELLRYDGPVNPGIWRYARSDAEIGGVRIPRGACVLVAIAAANRDPDVFPDPHRLDLIRTRNPQLAFGHGAHYCFGARLARAEAEIGIGTLIGRFSGISLAVRREDLRWRESVGRGLVELPVLLGQ
ncbi:cytochrome P450 family protein [Amycolatopsis silviterrae]|uniref:Cytochrome P450 n=1 Tax=Amycolatopsis silviterrae TaxID=1656914 RepID=A0ABW5HI39_9PSEU